MNKKHYITRAGFLALEDELKSLWKDERPKMTQAVSEAAALGDRSENAEYIYGKKRLREIDRRIRFLTKRLEILTIVDSHSSQAGKVFFGAFVTVEDDDERVETFRIVGADEFDPKKKWISINSPVARALIGHKIDDEITIKTPNGEVHYLILNIEYADPD